MQYSVEDRQLRKQVQSMVFRMLVGQLTGQLHTRICIYPEEDAVKNQALELYHVDSRHGWCFHVIRARGCNNPC